MRTSSAASRSSSGYAANHAPRFAASISPGPPPVATRYPDRANARPSSAIATYRPLPRASPWPPMTPTTDRPRRCRARAASMDASWTARASVTSSAWPLAWNQSPIAWSTVRPSFVRAFSSCCVYNRSRHGVNGSGPGGSGISTGRGPYPPRFGRPVVHPEFPRWQRPGNGGRAPCTDEQIPAPRGVARPARRARQGRDGHLRRSTATWCRSTSTSSMAIRPSTSWWSRCSPSSTAGCSRPRSTPPAPARCCPARRPRPDRSRCWTPSAGPATWPRRVTRLPSGGSWPPPVTPRRCGWRRSTRRVRCRPDASRWPAARRWCNGRTTCPRRSAVGRRRRCGSWRCPTASRRPGASPSSPARARCGSPRRRSRASTH